MYSVKWKLHIKINKLQKKKGFGWLILWIDPFAFSCGRQMAFSNEKKLLKNYLSQQGLRDHSLNQNGGLISKNVNGQIYTIATAPSHSTRTPTLLPFLNVPYAIWTPWTGYKIHWFTCIFELFWKNSSYVSGVRRMYLCGFLSLYLSLFRCLLQEPIRLKVLWVDA